MRRKSSVVVPIHVLFVILAHCFPLGCASGGLEGESEQAHDEGDLGAVCRAIELDPNLVAREVTFSSRLAPREHPRALVIKTNLPEDTEFIATVKLGGDRAILDTVRDDVGLHVSERCLFLLLPPTLIRGTSYDVQLMLQDAADQPSSVRRVIGEHGERLTGRLVSRGTVEPGTESPGEAFLMIKGQLVPGSEGVVFGAVQ